MKQQDSHIGREILALEKQFWNAIREKDAATAAALSDDSCVVAVAYKVKEGLVVEGQDLNLDAFDSSIWVRRGDHWVCVVHTESLAGDPYGRH